jgi:hypothetical protein
MKRITTLALLFAVSISLLAQVSAGADKTLTASEAKNHIGEKATVCGLVASTHYAAQSKGAPTFINLDKAYPNVIFTILIWGEDLPKFTGKPASWEGKRVCATGTISAYRGTESKREIGDCPFGIGMAGLHPAVAMDRDSFFRICRLSSQSDLVRDWTRILFARPLDFPPFPCGSIHQLVA